MRRAVPVALGLAVIVAVVVARGGLTDPRPGNVRQVEPGEWFSYHTEFLPRSEQWTPEAARHVADGGADWLRGRGCRFARAEADRSARLPTDTETHHWVAFVAFWACPDPLPRRRR